MLHKAQGSGIREDEYHGGPMIETREALSSAAERALEAPYVALDTEFFWERTYYPKLALMQIGYPDGDTALVDPLRLPDLSPLGKVLESSETTKVLHSAGHDLSILWRETGGRPRNVYDTQIAAGFVGLPSTLSLARLLKELLGIHITKAETRSNWLRRPLTNAQMMYARSDVQYLLPAMQQLQRRAHDVERTEWVRDELAQLEHPSRYEDGDPWDYYLRIKAGRKLSRRQLTVLQHLVMWRETTARRRNVVRSSILSDKELVLLARRLPRTERAIGSMRSLNANTRGRSASVILEVLIRGMAAKLCPDRPSGAPPDRAHSARTHLLEAYLTGCSLARGVDPVLVANRADISSFVARPMDPALKLHRGWRWDFVGAELAQILRGTRCVAIDPDTGMPGVAGEGHL